MRSPFSKYGLVKAAVALATLFSSAHALSAPTPQDPAAAQSERLGVELAAVANGAKLTFDELGALLLRRNGLTPGGRAALRELIDLKVIEHLAKERGVVISQAKLNRRWTEIEKDIIESGQASNMAEFLESSGVDRETFRHYLQLALIQETLALKALGLPDNSKINAEQQQLWLESEIEPLGYQEHPSYWEDGVVCTLGPITVTTTEFAGRLRDQMETKDIRQTCYEALLFKKIRARFPDLAPSAEAQAIDFEVELRRKDVEANPRYKGVKYENLLQSQGLTLQSLKLDPALRSSALSRLWVDRTCDDACLREFYESERENFDGHFGEGVETFAILLKAAKLKNDMNPRTFEEAESTLQELRKDIKGLEDFKRIAGVRTDDLNARAANGLVGWVRRRTAGVDPVIRKTVSDTLDATPGPVQDTIIGPLRVKGGVALIGLGARAAAPTWEVMSQNVHRELRRRFMVEQLPTTEFECWLSAAPK